MPEVDWDHRVATETMEPRSRSARWSHSTNETAVPDLQALAKGQPWDRQHSLPQLRQPTSQSRATRKKEKWQSLRREDLEVHKRWLVYSGSERPLHLHPLSSLMETQDFGHSMGSQEDNKHYFLVSWDLTSLSLLATCTGLGEGGMKGAVQLLHPTGKNWRSAGFFLEGQVWTFLPRTPG